MKPKINQPPELAGRKSTVGDVICGFMYKVIKGSSFKHQVRKVVKIHSSGHLVYLESRPGENGAALYVNPRYLMKVNEELPANDEEK